MSEELPEVGLWAKDKLNRLRAYLSAYTKIMRTQTWVQGYVYIDAFAGSGRARIRRAPAVEARNAFLSIGREFRSAEEAQQILNGSPGVALETDPSFTLYVFLERAPKRVALLRSLCEEYKGRRKIRIRTGDCNDYLRKTVAEVDWRTWRAVVFLDPFGMQVPWSTIAALAQTKGIEVFLNFPVGMSIQRLLRKDATFTERQRKKLDDYFGDPGWFDAVYPESPGLFGPEQWKAEDAERRLVRWYRERLKRAFGYVSDAYLVKNSHGGHLYFLIFAGPNPTGARIASYVLRGGIKAPTR